ncbi:YesL family protein [Bacillus sp. ISL-18]|uniref:YesL family protein n=1 Tax=Bacillus sp. ISL-18 TaxID=2819118 RepID=UPI001BE9C850|nr:YesL family protein [Bacillus sp. ISL-18]MBT2654064.1 YesL family protein [Bacillus sp. ISL-18]
MIGFMRGFYSISEWILRFAYVNVLWIAFTLLGFVVFGFFPSTLAMFTVVRKWVLKQTDIPVFPTFWFTYKKEFVKGNLLGFFLGLSCFLMYSNIRIVEATTVPLFKLLYIPNVIVIILFFFTLLYIFPVLVHFDVRLKEGFKNSFILMTINPIPTFCMATLTGFLCFIFMKLPGVIPFFSGSLIAYLLMWLSNFVFVKMNRASDLSVKRTKTGAI